VLEKGAVRADAVAEGDVQVAVAEGGHEGSGRERLGLGECRWLRVRLKWGFWLESRGMWIMR
jgi:hypothetical protein